MLPAHEWKYIATFTPQEEVRGVQVYPLRIEDVSALKIKSAKYDVTHEIDALGCIPEAGQYNDALGRLRFAIDAPQWVKEWDGPCRISVETVSSAQYARNLSKQRALI